MNGSRADEASSARLPARVAALIDRLADGSRDDDARDALLVDALTAQAATIEPYARLVRVRGHGATPDSFPALPTEVFRHVRVAAHPARADVRVFRTSGTTHGVRGEHAFADLGLYDRAARAAATHALFPDRIRMSLVVVAPDPRLTPDSSLAYMIGRFADWFGDGDPVWALGASSIDVDAVVRALERAMSRVAPVAILGTSFGLTDLDERLGARRFALPAASRIMPTGGFKGRRHEISPDALRAQLSVRYGVPESHVVAEYGMTELSSQLYETTLRDAVMETPAASRRLWVPGWVRARPVDAETLQPVAPGVVGVLRIDDLANLGSVCAIQTADLARGVDGGIELLGRAPGAVPRGCSLATEEALT